MEREIVHSYKTNNPETNPIQFFHIPKTGGTTFTGILFAMAQGLKRTYTFIPEKVGQFLVPFDPSSMPTDSLVYAGHCQYRFASFLPRALSRISLIRNPVDRIVSEYFWIHKAPDRQQYLAETKDHFIPYLRNFASNNECCRHLSEDHAVFWDSATKSIDEIEQSFCFGTTENINAMASYVLSKYNAPSVVTENAKVSADPRQAYFKETFAEPILEHNRYDHELYEYVKKQEAQNRFEPDKKAPLNTNAIYAQNVSGKQFNFKRVSLRAFEPGEA